MKNKTHTVNRKPILICAETNMLPQGAFTFLLLRIFRAATVQILERPQICWKPK